MFFSWTWTSVTIFESSIGIEAHRTRPSLWRPRPHKWSWLCLRNFSINTEPSQEMFAFAQNHRTAMIHTADLWVALWRSHTNTTKQGGRSMRINVHEKHHKHIWCSQFCSANQFNSVLVSKSSVHAAEAPSTIRQKTLAVTSKLSPCGRGLNLLRGL